MISGRGRLPTLGADKQETKLTKSARTLSFFGSTEIQSFVAAEVESENGKKIKGFVIQYNLVFFVFVLTFCELWQERG